ncbi:RimK family alpha-L-glutamate ligase [Candidatus Collierbacteria bacterium]|nr:RimK family alpha-L-glutamate ligase [Candidatus Collierbacteria bacterium]
MKITLLTNFDAIETIRIKNEAKVLGHQLTILDARANHPVIQDNKLTVEGLTDSKVDLVITRGVILGIKEIVAVLSHLRATGTKVFDNNLINLNYSINKVTDLMKLALAEVAIPNTRHSHDFEDFQSLAQELKFPLIIKPTSTGKGAGVVKIENEQELFDFTARAIRDERTAKRYVMQEFIPYIHDLRLLIIGDHIYCMERIPREGDFRANFSLGGTVELFKPSAETVALAQKALQATGMSVGGVDVLITEAGRQYILEVNHNPGFEGMELATKENIAKIYLEHAIKEAR